MQARREAARLPLDLGLDQLGGGERVGAGGEADRDAGAGMAVDPAEDLVILGAELDPGDVREVDDRAVGLGLEDDVAELLGRRQPRLGGDGGVEHLLGRHRLGADLARRDLGILRLDRRDDVAGASADSWRAGPD